MRLSIIFFFFFLFFYSCCSHLEHRASAKRFVSLQFLNLRQSVGLLGRGINQSQGPYLTQTRNKRKQTSIPWVGFEPRIPVFEWAKTFHALDNAATMIGGTQYKQRSYNFSTYRSCHYLSLTFSLQLSHSTALAYNWLRQAKTFLRAQKSIS
jgi:hypothetical protein